MTKPADFGFTASPREEIARRWKLERRFEPRMQRKEAEAKMARWREAVSRSDDRSGRR